jgi:Zn-dependent protease with chaperone function
MMLAWMIYVLLVAAVLSVAALAAEKVARLRGKPSRWIWMLAIVGSLLIPVVMSSVSVSVPASIDRAAAGRSIPLRQVTSERLSPTNLIGAPARRAFVSPTLESSLLRCWETASAVLLILVCASGTHLWWRRRRWIKQDVVGVAVYVAPDIGPAVVGLLSPRIVVPKWLLELPGSQQATVIAHERSHLEARDPQALALALGVLVCAPWNLPLWWQWRRLRHAIEVDCDSRVLKSGRDATSYGETLLAVGQRQAASFATVAAMSEPHSFLEERLIIMLRKPHASWPLAAAALGCLSLTLSAVATQIAPPADITTADAAAGQQRVLVQVPAATLDGYAGYYGYGGGAFVTVKHVDQHLTVEFSGTQSVQAVYPESATTFFYVDRDAQIRFSSDPGGQATTATILQNGASTPMSRIDAAAAQALQASLDARVQAQTPSQGSEAMLRRLMAGITAGKPNLEEMNPQLAAAIRKDLPKLQVKLADLGPVESIQLLRVTQAGMDVYKVQHDRGSSEWSIELSPAGTLVGAMVP